MGIGFRLLPVGFSGKLSGDAGHVPYAGKAVAY
jgi:hypothetical protein